MGMEGTMIEEKEFEISFLEEILKNFLECIPTVTL
jgi:hypothetical protein